MNKMRLILMALTLAVVPGSYLLIAQQPPPPAPQGGRGPAPAPQPMSFFITSVPARATARTTAGSRVRTRTASNSARPPVGRGRDVARVSEHAGRGAVNARDRIGNGPWYNANGAMVAMNVAQLHGDTIEQARVGNALGKQFSLTEKKERVNGVGTCRTSTTS